MNDLTARLLDVYDYLLSEKIVDNPSGFAKMIGISNSMMTEIVKKRSNAGITPIQNTVMTFPIINAEWLISGKGSMLKSENVIEGVPIKAGSNVIQVDFTADIDTVDIPIVDIYAAAGSGSFNPDYIDQLGVIRLPANMVKRGANYCVRIQGSSMAPTIQDSDYVIVRLLEPSDWRYMPDEHVYLVVDKEGAAYMKRVKNRFEKGFIVCTSDSIEKVLYPNFNLQADQIFNVFHAEWYLSAKMQNINDTYYNRLKLLEDDVSDIKEHLTRIR